MAVDAGYISHFGFWVGGMAAPANPIICPDAVPTRDRIVFATAKGTNPYAYTRAVHVKQGHSDTCLIRNPSEGIVFP